MQREKASSGRWTASSGLVVLPPDPGKKSRHLALITHRGGGWYQVECMGQARKCKTGQCKHTAGLGYRHKSNRVRPIKQVPRASNNQPEEGTT